jgi:hypothetical protein
MSASLSVRLESESGQTLVFVVLSLLVLVLFVGLVIDVGSWKRGQRRAQAAADAAALAAVQRLPDTDAAVADAIDYAQRNWSDVGVPPPTVTADSITVVATHNMPGVVAGIIPVTVKADATARVGVPARIANLVPIALRCQDPCDPWEFGESVTFTFDEANQMWPNSTFGPIRLPEVNTEEEFNRFLRCDVHAPNPFDCNPEDAILTAYERFDRTADELRTALQVAAALGTHLVPIYDDYSVGIGGYKLVGWAAFSFSPPTDAGPGIIEINGTFESLLVAGTGRNSLPPTENELNFGVRAVGLVD